jgi:hypothetical protein
MPRGHPVDSVCSDRLATKFIGLSTQADNTGFFGAQVRIEGVIGPIGCTKAGLAVKDTSQLIC